MRVTTAVLAAVIALVLAGCGDDEDSTTEATLSPEQKIEQTIDKWAPLFATAADRAACRYETQPLRANRSTRSHGADKELHAAVVGVSEVVRGRDGPGHRDQGRPSGCRSRMARRSLFHRSGNLQAGVEEAGGWLIHKLGGNAGRAFLEAAGLSE